MKALVLYIAHLIRCRIRKFKVPYKRNEARFNDRKRGIG